MKKSRLYPHPVSLIVFILFMSCLCPAITISGFDLRGRDITLIDREELNLKINSDARTIRVVSQCMDSLAVFLDNYFDSLKLSKTEILSVQKRESIKQAWALFWDLSFVLQSIVVDYEKFYKLKAERRSDAFITGYAAYILLYARGLHFIDHTIGKTAFEVLLDDR